MSESSPSGHRRSIAPRLRAWLSRRWDTLFVIALATWILLPVPFEVPRSQDHTVHLARAWMVGQNLAAGHVADWSSTWFFGFPAGELYPVLGDLAVAAVRGLSLWMLPWAYCYALVFWLGYVLAALALTSIARSLGWGPWPGLVAAVLFLLDPGETREGGFRFTVFFGVWLQPLAVAWTWWALAELHAALAARPLLGRRLLRPIALLAGALLAHPITLPLVGITLVPWVVLRSRREWIRALASIALVVAIAFAAAAWFLLPMMAHRAWMANFGALHHDLARLAADAAAGHWATNMATPVGFTITAGLVWALWRGDGFARIAAVIAISSWLLASREAFWLPRLDWFSPGFGSLQYQRFILCAKPGFYLCAGLVVTAVARWISTHASARHNRAGLVVATIGATAWAGWLALATVTHAGALGLGGTEISRGAKPRAHARLQADWHEYLAWAAEQWTHRDGFYRFAYEAVSRHGHGFADAPVYTAAPAFKIGSTPGETFVHRVESSHSRVLDRLRVRYLVTVADTKGREVARFGSIRVLERPVTAEVARIVGPGALQVVKDDPERDGVVVDLDGTSAGSRVEFAISGYPRWELLHDGRPVEWYEVPALGLEPVASQQARRAGEFVAGRADRTEPTEPMLIAADAADGRWELRYRHLMPIDVLGFGLAVLAAVAAVALRFRSSIVGVTIDRVVARLHPIVTAAIVALALAAPTARWFENRQADRDLASTWLRSGRAVEVTGMHDCPIEIEREIRPAACIDSGEASATFPDVEVGAEPLTGFIAIEDGSRERAEGHADLEIAARVSGGEWTVVAHENFRFTQGKQDISVALDRFGIGSQVALRVRVGSSTGDKARLGVDFVLR